MNYSTGSYGTRSTKTITNYNHLWEVPTHQELKEKFKQETNPDGTYRFNLQNAVDIIPTPGNKKTNSSTLPYNTFQDDPFTPQYGEIQIGTPLAINPNAPKPILDLHSHLVGRIASAAVHPEDELLGKPFLATGILISKDLFLTTSHYCKTSSAFISKIKIQLETLTPLNAELVFGGFTPENDFAIFRLNPSTPNPYLNSETHRHCTTFGSRDESVEVYSLPACSEFFALKPGESPPPPKQEESRPTKPGDSGTPLINIAGDLIGIYSYIEDDLNWFIKLEQIFFCLHDYSQARSGDTEVILAKRTKVKDLYDELLRAHPELANNLEFQSSSLPSDFEDRPSSLPPSVLDPSESQEIFIEYKRRFEPISLRQEFHGGTPLEILASVRSGQITQEQLDNNANLNQRYQQGLDIERNQGVKANANNPVVELTPLTLDNNSLETLYETANQEGILNFLETNPKNTLHSVVYNQAGINRHDITGLLNVIGDKVSEKRKNKKENYQPHSNSRWDGGGQTVPRNKEGSNTVTDPKYIKQVKEKIEVHLKALFAKNNYTLQYPNP